MKDFKFLTPEYKWITIKVSSIRIHIHTNKNICTINDILKSTIKSYFLLSVPMSDYLMDQLQNDLRCVLNESKVFITKITSKGRHIKP